MGISHKAELIYGFKVIDQDLVDKLEDDKIKLDNKFEVTWDGSAYWGEDAPMDVYICLQNVHWSKKAEYWLETFISGDLI